MKLGVRMYGMGGQGIITLAKLIGEAAVEDGKFVIMTEEYSPYVTGGWSKADLVISDEEIDYPLPENIDYLITLSQEGLEANKDQLDSGSRIITEKSLVSLPSSLRNSALEIEAIEISKSLRNPKGANIVIMGAFAGRGGSFSEEAGEKVISNRFPKNAGPNLECFRRGLKEANTYGR